MFIKQKQKIEQGIKDKNFENWIKFMRKIGGWQYLLLTKLLDFSLNLL